VDARSHPLHLAVRDAVTPAERRTHVDVFVVEALVKVVVFPGAPFFETASTPFVGERFSDSVPREIDGLRLVRITHLG
jgi:hypothetical protein